MKSNRQDAGNIDKLPREELLGKIAKPLRTWYDTNKRILPWREQATPYHVWVSEIMLQQTRVEAVKGYYARFLDALPDIWSLAEAKEDELLKLWEGLGYYNRVRNMQKAALIVEEKYAGVMPDSYEELLKLPGIGSYTAGAIASIAYGKKVPAVDGNVLRVVTRILENDTDILNTGFKRMIEEKLKAAMPEDCPGDFNQGMMEIGAMVCIPNGMPKCTECPFESFCSAHRNGRELDYPVKKPKKPRKIEEKTILVIQDQETVVLQKRPEKGLLAGMYEFPSLHGRAEARQVLEFLKKCGIQAVRIEEMGEAKHIFSHVEWHMTGYHIKVDELAGADEREFVFVEIDKAREEYAIPSAYTAYAEKLNLGKEKRKK